MDGVIHNEKCTNWGNYPMIAGFCWIKYDLFGQRNKSGKATLRSCACSITAKGDGQVAVKEHWDVGVPSKDGITARETCQMSE